MTRKQNCSLLGSVSLCSVLHSLVLPHYSWFIPPNTINFKKVPSDLIPVWDPNQIPHSETLKKRVKCSLLLKFPTNIFQFSWVPVKSEPFCFKFTRLYALPGQWERHHKHHKQILGLPHVLFSACFVFLHHHNSPEKQHCAWNCSL